MVDIIDTSQEVSIGLTAPAAAAIPLWPLLLLIPIGIGGLYYATRRR
jgi:hypothetical protein